MRTVCNSRQLCDTDNPTLKLYSSEGNKDMSEETLFPCVFEDTTFA